MVRQGRGWRTAIVLAAAFGLGVAAVVAWEPLVARYQVGRLREGASVSAVQEWFERRPHLAGPYLAPLWARSDPALGRSVGLVLQAVVTSPAARKESAAIAGLVNDSYGRFSPAGRVEAVRLAGIILESFRSAPDDGLAPAIDAAGSVILLGLADELAVAEQALAVLERAGACGLNSDAAPESLARWRQRAADRAQGLLDGPSLLRAQAARALARSGSVEQARQVVGLLADPDVAVRRAAILAARRIGGATIGTAGKASLVDFLHDSDEAVREAATELLESMGMAEPILALARRMKHPEPAERMHAAAMAFEIDGIDPAFVLAELYRDQCPQVRQASAAAVRAELIEHEDRSIRALAVMALAENDVAHVQLSPDQKMQVIEFLHDSDPRLVLDAERLLRKSGLGDAAIRMAQRLRHPLAAERAKVPSMAFGVADIDPIPWVLALVADPSPAVRVAVARAAATAGESQLSGALMEMAQKDPDPTVRSLCRGYLMRSAAGPPATTR